jgi:TatD DNase family protein
MPCLPRESSNSKSRLVEKANFDLDILDCWDPVIFIDTHTHLYLREFREDRDEVVNSALDKGIRKMLLPNVDGRTINAMNSLADKFPDHCLPMIGLHPTSVKNGYNEEIGQLRKLFCKRKYWGIGESGIDLYWDKTYLEQQADSFRDHINLAKEHGLPLIIHARNSFDEIFRIMDRENDDTLRGIFHAFTGDADQARRIIEYGFKLGIGGIVTFKNSGLDRVVKEIDIQHIVLETDAPYLAPVPRRGKRNEPAYLLYTAEKIAEIHRVPLETIAEITTQTATSLFNL